MKALGILSLAAAILFGFGSANIQAQPCAPAPIGLVAAYSGDNNASDARSRSNGTLQNGGTNLTLEAWINPSSLPHGGTIIQKRTNGNDVGKYVLEPTQNLGGGNSNGLGFYIVIGGAWIILQSRSGQVQYAQFGASGGDAPVSAVYQP